MEAASLKLGDHSIYKGVECNIPVDLFGAVNNHTYKHKMQAKHAVAVSLNI